MRGAGSIGVSPQSSDLSQSRDPPQNPTGFGQNPRLGQDPRFGQNPRFGQSRYLPAKPVSPVRAGILIRSAAPGRVRDAGPTGDPMAPGRYGVSCWVGLLCPPGLCLPQGLYSFGKKRCLLPGVRSL
jgi:hypothetical protein